MKKIELTAFDVAQRFIGVAETPGLLSNEQVMAMLRLDQSWPGNDEVPWCSAFVNYVMWLLRLPRTKSLRARSWLMIGQVVTLDSAEVGFDIAVLKRGGGPGIEVKEAAGHVGFYAGRHGNFISVLGGNQANAVNVSDFPVVDLLGIRRVT